LAVGFLEDFLGGFGQDERMGAVIPAGGPEGFANELVWFEQSLEGP